MKITLDLNTKQNKLHISTPKIELKKSGVNYTNKTADVLLSSAFLNAYKLSFTGKGDFTSLKMDRKNPKWEQAVSRTKPIYQKSDDLRSEFERDYGRIFHSNRYEKLKHKTQFTLFHDDERICTRINHVQQVTDITRKISKQLGLNEELAEAIAIGHDIGHAPFGHQGEVALRKVCKKYDLDNFWHEKNSLKAADKFSLMQGADGNYENMNLTYAVRDGIISHCGEVDDNGLKPRDEVLDLYTLKKGTFNPYTWEACVMKISDKIAYIGRDIEDAFKLGYLNEKNKQDYKEIQKKHLPDKDFEINNTNLINLFVNDVIKNSNPKDGITFSPEVYGFISAIKKYNFKNIYNTKKIDDYPIRHLEGAFNITFEVFDNMYDGKNTIENLDKNSHIYPTYDFKNWLINYSNLPQRPKNIQTKPEYDINNRKDYRQAIIDFMSSMTDRQSKSIYDGIIFKFKQR